MGLRDQPDGVAVVDMLVGPVALFVVAIVQPLLDLLGRNAEFFIARDATASDIIWFTILVVLILPLLVALIPIVIGVISPVGGKWAYSFVIGVLAGIFGLILSRHLGPASFAITIAIAVGVGIAVLVLRSELARRFLRVGAILPLLVGGLFLFGSDAARLLEGGGAFVGATALRDKVPVVLVVFDEIPAISLMRPDGSLDEDLFPNFGRLARVSTWFRNAAGVSGVTSRAVPAILDGRYPHKDELPIPVDHPRTLFALLGHDYKVIAQEPLMQLCPEDVCSHKSANDAESMWKGLASDLAIVGLHLTLPQEITSDLPPVNENWGGFAELEPEEPAGEEATFHFRGPYDRRPARVRSLIRSIRRRKVPHFYFLHSVLPHASWRYLPDGRSYPQESPVPGGAFGRTGRYWKADEWLVAQIYQRHLLQLQFVDKLLGELLDRLEHQGLLDQVLLVVTADHGASFRPDESSRSGTPTSDTAAEVAFVPLFVKRPHSSRGGIVDAPVSTLDIMPTVIELLGGRPPARIDGRSLFGSLPRNRKRFIGLGRAIALRVEQWDEKLATMHALFAPGGRRDLFVFGPGATEEMIGRDVQELGTVQATDAGFTLDRARFYEELDPSSAVVPSLIGGTLSRVQPKTVLAIGVNGRVAAVTRSYEEDGHTKFYAMVPPTAFRAGANDIEVFVVEGQRLTRLAG